MYFTNGSSVNLSENFTSKGDILSFAPGSAAVVALLTCVLSIMTVTGNMLVILSVGIFRGLNNVPNTLISSLAVADFTMGAMVMPLGSYYILRGVWVLGKPMCELWISVDVLSVTASIGTLGAISVDRFIAVTTPFKYPQLATRKRTRTAIVIIWGVSLVIAFVPVQCGWWKSTEPLDVACYKNAACCEFLTNKTYAVVSSLISFYIPLLIMAASYHIVFKGSVIEGIQMLMMERRNRRSLLMAKIIMGTFVGCWMPFFVINITEVFCNRCVGTPVFTIANWLGYANSFFNPIIYCHSGRFRRAFKKLLKCQVCLQGYRVTSRGSLSYPHKFQKSTDHQNKS